MKDFELRLDVSLLRPGMRLAAGVSGGADSVALLRALHSRASELGLVLNVAHLHHGLRGAEADADLEFVRELAGRLEVPFLTKHVDVAAEAAKLPGKPAETLEEAARRVRYAWFRELIRDGTLDAVATAHTLDDQAETVLAKVLRGAWTGGMAGIHPVVEFAEGRVIRPMLGTRRAEVEAYLKALEQEWREDSSNRHLTFTRNRIRHELLPALEGWNPRLKEHLALFPMGYLLQHLYFVAFFVVPFVLVFWMLPLWFICKKAGFSPWLTLINCIPFGNPVLLYLLAFADWKRYPMFQAEPVPPPAPVQPAPSAARPHIVPRRIQP